MYYDKNRVALYLNPEKWNRGEKDTAAGWNLFALHVERLASHYTPDQKDQFVRDFALLFGGVPTASKNDLAAMWDVAGGPSIPLDESGDSSFLHYQNTGLKSEYVDIRQKENQSHHYAGIFYLAHWASPDAAAVINYARDPQNPGDLNLGGQAAIDAYIFWTATTDLSSLSRDISQLSSLP